ncbi:hypothetical protein C8R44DRAFT_745950 [Mycena epipterygia]|nr:hypothetical protein C8R44DRAFT_745950 [Mycena epipterygia]
MPNQCVTDPNRWPKQRGSAHRRIVAGSQSIGFTIREDRVDSGDVSGDGMRTGLAGTELRTQIADPIYGVGWRAANAQHLANTPGHLRMRHRNEFNPPERRRRFGEMGRGSMNGSRARSEFCASQLANTQTREAAWERNHAQRLTNAQRVRHYCGLGPDLKRKRATRSGAIGAVYDSARDPARRRCKWRKRAGAGKEKGVR